MPDQPANTSVEPAQIEPHAKLEDIAKVIAILIGGSYGIGLLISNGYLASLGVMDFDLLRPRAILSGLWFIVFFTVALVAEESSQRAFKLKDIPFSWKILNSVFPLTGAVIFYFIAFTVIQAPIQRPLRARLVVSFVWPLLIFITAGFVITEAQNAVKEWKRRTTDKKMGPTSAWFFLAHCSSVAVGLVVFSYFFVTNFYQYLPQQYGGGKPISIEIAVSDKAAQILNDFSIVTNKNIVHGAVFLIHDTSEAIAIRVDGGKTIMLPRREVMAIRNM